MFYGIVTGCFPVNKISKSERLYEFSIVLTKELVYGLKKGSSVSVDGVCLTVTKIEDTEVFFDVMGETLDHTTLKFITEREFFNVERSARSGDEIGGHLISGHIDGLAQITQIETPVNNYIVTCTIPDTLSRYIFRKGFIGINGASLTITDVDRKNNWFCVHLIPETLRLTTFGMKKVGDFLNIEIDRNTQVLVDTLYDLLDQNRQFIYQSNLFDATLEVMDMNSEVMSLLPKRRLH